jgi:toxin ParE1/3/4
MAHKIIWSPEAVEDLIEIRNYIARDSESYAAGMVESVLESVDQLAEFPLMGRRVAEFDDDAIRELIVGPYRVIYRTGRDSADIAAIVHGARDLLRALAQRDL